ncbi:hypothetical protein HMPREF1485_01588 [Propionibacterium sp. HGH0353]|nr:hypothetical protein HMPREF1485_01588 [Propionibacterium sp. HGH0353]
MRQKRHRPHQRTHLTLRDSDGTVFSNFSNTFKMKGIIHGRKDNTLYGHMTVCNGLAFHKIIMSSHVYARMKKNVNFAHPRMNIENAIMILFVLSF